MSRETYTLSDAVRMGQILTVRCGCCGVKRHYRPEDWLRLLGDVPTYRLESELICSRCKTSDYLRLKPSIPSAADRQAMTLRRVKEVRMVRKIVWGDE